MSINKVGLSCVGCKACKQVCALQCIEFVENDEGFSYPIVADNSSCVECGLCENVCPALVIPKHYQQQQAVYAAWNKSDAQIHQSSSGGIFSVIAEHIIKKNGVVFGCAFDEKLYAHHIQVDTLEGLRSLRGSKYVQSELGDTYNHVKEVLENNRYALFVGTPCQVAGLKNFLQKEYEHLYTADLICHGVPSSKMFERYIQWREQKHHGKIKDYQFRNKDKHGWSLSYSFYVKRKHGKEKRFQGIGSLSPYYYGFLSGIFYRECCYRCNYCSPERTGDITLGDFWGAEEQCPHIKTEKGISAILVNSQKGMLLINDMQEAMNSEDITFDMVSCQNKNLLKPTLRPSLRDSIYIELNEKGFSSIAKSYFKPPHYMLEYVKSCVPNHLRQKVKRIIRK